MAKKFEEFLKLKENLDINPLFHNLNFFYILKQISRKQCVRFALYCTKDCYSYIKQQPTKTGQKCIDLTEKWLMNPDSVTIEELKDAAHFAYYETSFNSPAYFTVDTIYSHPSWAQNTVTEAAKLKAIKDFPENQEQRQERQREYLEEYKRILISRFATRFNDEELASFVKTNDPNEKLIRLDYIKDNLDKYLPRLIRQNNDNSYYLELGDIHLTGKTVSEIIRKIESNNDLTERIANELNDIIIKF